MKRTYRDLLILVTAFGIVWLVFSQYNGFFHKGDSIVPEATQEKLAETLKEIVFKKFDTLDNPVVRNSMDSIMQRLRTGLDSLNDDLQIHLLNHDEVNAFATLKGDIFVFSGLIKFSDSPEMLASVLAHEIGHIVNGHYVKRLSREVGINVVFSVMTGGDPATVSELSKTLFSLKFDRDEERAADEFASDLLLKSGINPSVSTQFFLKLQREYIENNSMAPEVFMTHPDIRTRIEQTSAYTVPPDFIEKHFTLDWEATLRALDTDTLTDRRQ